MVNKIINYEKNAYGQDWFEKMTVISGDGFLDQNDLNIQWDVKDLDDGQYTIYAQSWNDEGDFGGIDEVTVTLDRNVKSKITFVHDDHLQVDNYPNFPWTPIAEITSPSNGDILGNSDVDYDPGERVAYGNDFMHWANVTYLDEVMIIRGKSYDPQPYGDITDIHIWIEDSSNQEVFSAWRNNTKMVYEGEWTTGNELLKGRGGALYYMPNDFTKKILWGSNGGITGMSEVIEEFSKGAGFIFFSGHGSPSSWGDQYPGIPGNRQNGSYTGLITYSTKLFPYLIMDFSIRNYNMPAILAVGGCHNSQFNVSYIAGKLDIGGRHHMWCYGFGAAECWSWWLTRLNNRGAIASMGNTGLGYGTLGDDCNIGGLDAWITTEVFRQYSIEGHDILGDAYVNTLIDYVNLFDLTLLEEGHAKTVQQWVLHGDPSLKIGGYSPDENQPLRINIEGTGNYGDGNPGSTIGIKAAAIGNPTYYWDLDNDGEFDDAIGDITEEIWDTPGLYEVGVKAVYDNGQETVSNTLVEIILDEFPTKPTKPSGPSGVKAGREYTYKTSSSDPNGFKMYYLFDWGDGDHSVVGPEPSGKVVNAKHTWAETGSYEVKVQAINELAYWSDWSNPLLITTPRARLTDHTFLLSLLEKFPNAFPMIRYILGL
jgi:hypothetical protein